MLGFERRQRVLLTDREDGRGWVPPGGHIEDGEVFAKAAVREAEEEIGIRVREDQLRLLGAYPAIGKDGEPACTVVFYAKWRAVPVCLNSTEVREVRWFSQEEVDRVRIPFGLRVAVEDVLAGREIDSRPDNSEILLDGVYPRP